MRLAHLLLAAACALSALPFGAQADPALWVVHSRSATIYLFGTVHILPAGMSWRTTLIDQALARSSEIWTEADVGRLAPMVAAIRRYGLEKGPAITTQLPPQYRDRYLAQMQATGLNPQLFAHVRPWLAEIMLSGGAIQHSGLGVTLGVEPTLMGYAHANHKATPFFETAEEQFAILADLPQDAQLASLEEQIDEYDDTRSDFAHLARAWHDGDVEAIDTLGNGPMRRHSLRSWTDLIERRNVRFAEKIADRLQGAGTAFVAVGAAHLCGSAGVQADLISKGFVVTRLE